MSGLAYQPYKCSISPTSCIPCTTSNIFERLTLFYNCYNFIVYDIPSDRNSFLIWPRRDRDRVVVGFTSTYAICVYQH
jgi:hypothetical protein